MEMLGLGMDRGVPLQVAFSCIFKDHLSKGVISSMAVLGKNIWGLAPHHLGFGRQQRLSEITTEPKK